MARNHTRVTRRVFTEDQTRSYIEKTCKEYGFTSSMVNGRAFIHTPRGNWVITLAPDGNVECLHHENMMGGGAKYSDQYHKQDWTGRSLPNALWYIRNHDNGKLWAKQRSQTDRLFALIATA